MAEEHAGEGRHPQHQQRGGCDQLRDAGSRASRCTRSIIICSPKARDGKPPTIVVRRAAEGEKFKTLDGQERTLTSQMLLIADETKGIALAGVMGGQNSEINERTVDVLIESAYFKPQNIRAHLQDAGAAHRILATASSAGADIGICDWASRRAAQLILETAGGKLAEGVVDAYPQAVRAEGKSRCAIARPMHCSASQFRPEQQIESICSRLGLKIDTAAGIAPVDGDADAAHDRTFRIPTFRVDLKREVDLIEEVARLYGVDKIPATAAARRDRRERVRRRARPTRRSAPHSDRAWA